MNSDLATAKRTGRAPSPAPPIRLMIVDDSSVARAILARLASADPGLEVVAQAANAREALDALRTVEVDIVLLDLEMPGASGIEALPHIIAAGRGARVLIVSSMAEDGAEVTVRALAEGAADTLPKPGAGTFSGRFGEVLVNRLRRIGHADRAVGGSRKSAPPVSLRAMPSFPTACVALGSSTGGLHALIEFMRGLTGPVEFPLLVTQHLPAVFMPYFARQLEMAAGRPARIAEDGQWLEEGTLHVAPGDAHLRIERIGPSVRVRLDRRRAPSGCLPSVDPMLDSVAEVYGPGGVGVILSGMGRDGLVGSRALVASGGAVLSQDPVSSSIWGMPRAVAEEGLASAMMAPRELARRIVQHNEAATWK